MNYHVIERSSKIYTFDFTTISISMVIVQTSEV